MQTSTPRVPGGAPGVGPQAPQTADTLANYLATYGCDGSPTLHNLIARFQNQTGGGLPITGQFDAATAAALATYNERTFFPCTQGNLGSRSTMQYGFAAPPSGLGAATTSSNTTLYLVGLAAAGVVGWAIWQNKKGRRR